MDFDAVFGGMKCGPILVAIWTAGWIKEYFYRLLYLVLQFL